MKYGLPGPVGCSRVPGEGRIVHLTAVFEPAEEGGFIAYVEELPGANTQGETLDEARENLLDAVRELLAANRESAEQQLAGRAVIREPLELDR